jgi:hypothetical protein
MFIEIKKIILFARQNSRHDTVNVIHSHSRKFPRPMICSLTGFKLRFDHNYSILLSILIFASSLLLQHFLILIDIDTTRRTKCLLYNYYERRTQGDSLLLTILSIFASPWLTFAFCINAPFFLGWSKGIKTDMSSLAAGMDEHVVRIGIRRKGDRGEIDFF